MDQEIKKQWVEALRSGKYEQGRSFLRRDNDKFCCLGVLCNLVDSTRWQEGDEFYDYDGGFTTRLPFMLMNELELKFSEEKKLIHLNDGGHSFEEIADWIEENL